MVGRPPNAFPDMYQAYTPRKGAQAKGSMKHGKPAAWVRFTPELFAAIRAEAERNHCSFTQQVVLLCYASINGIE